jgi:GT2 family glycosyltransferase
MQNRPDVSVVIGTYNRLDFLKKTLETIRKELTSINHEVIIVDGGSTDGTLKWLLEQKDVISIIQHNRGEWMGKQIERKSWGYFMNLGFKAAGAKYICMLSDDCLLVPGAIRNGIALFDKELRAGKKIGAMAFYWRNWPEQKKYQVGHTFGGNLFVNHGLYLRELLEKIGFADEDNFFFYHADGDICLRMNKAGYKCLDSPDSFIEHYSEANMPVRKSNLERQQTDWKAYSQRWGYLGEPPNDWSEKEFFDQSHTADKYWGRKKRLFRRES